MPPAQSSTSKACKQDGQHRNDETPLPATMDDLRTQRRLLRGEGR
jgi:hypothetical protein